MNKRKPAAIILCILALLLLTVACSEAGKTPDETVTKPTVEAHSDSAALDHAEDTADPSQPLPNGTEQNSDNNEEEPSANTTAPSAGTAPQETTPTESAADDAELQAQIDALIARTYALCDEYTARLAALEAAALAEYDALLPEKRTEEAVRAIALYYSDQAYYLENECDAIMDEICTELSYLLLESDGDLSLVNDVRYAYAQKKAAEKARFMSAYAGYL